MERGARLQSVHLEPFLHASRVVGIQSIASFAMIGALFWFVIWFFVVAFVGGVLVSCKMLPMNRVSSVMVMLERCGRSTTLVAPETEWD